MRKLETHFSVHLDCDKIMICEPIRLKFRTLSDPYPKLCFWASWVLIFQFLLSQNRRNVTNSCGISSLDSCETQRAWTQLLGGLHWSLWKKDTGNEEISPSTFQKHIIFWGCDQYEKSYSVLNIMEIPSKCLIFYQKQLLDYTRRARVAPKGLFV